MLNEDQPFFLSLKYGSQASLGLVTSGSGATCPMAAWSKYPSALSPRRSLSMLSARHCPLGHCPSLSFGDPGGLSNTEPIPLHSWGGTVAHAKPTRFGMRENPTFPFQL